MKQGKLEIEGMLTGHFVGKVPHGHGKPVAYVMDGGGLWEIRQSPLGEFRRCVAAVRIPGLASTLSEGFDLTVPKIPYRCCGRRLHSFVRCAHYMALRRLSGSFTILS